MTRLVLASGSASRQAMLAAAQVPHDVIHPRVDEESAKAALRAEGHGARNLADALAELKALSVSRRLRGVIVLGCDSTLEFDDGTMLDKPADRAEAAVQLRQLRGRRHALISATVAARDGVAIWRHVDRAQLTMRAFSDSFLERYLDAEGGAILGCVGCYRVEGLGAQLFERIDGSLFTIRGLPLLPLLAWLREQGVLPA